MQTNIIKAKFICSHEKTSEDNSLLPFETKRLNLKEGRLYHLEYLIDGLQIDQVSNYLNKTVFKFSDSKLLNFASESIDNLYNVYIENIENSDDEDIVELVLKEYPEEFQEQYRRINFILLGNSNEIEYSEIIAILDKIDGTPFLKLFYLCICNFFQNNFSEMGNTLDSIKLYYPFIYNSNIVQKFLEFKNVVDRSIIIETCNSVFVLGSSDKATRTIQYSLYESIFKFTDKNLSFENLSSINFRKEENLYNKIGNSHPSHIVFISHGSTDKGLYLSIDGNPKRIETKELISLFKAFSKKHQSAIIMLGCNPDLYTKITDDQIQDKYLIYSPSVNDVNRRLFLYGFYKIFRKSGNLKLAYHAGRLSVSIRGIEKNDYQLLEI